MFIEGADIPHLGDKPYKLKETLRTVSPSGGVVTTTKTVFSKPGVVGKFVFDMEFIIHYYRHEHLPEQGSLKRALSLRFHVIKAVYMDITSFSDVTFRSLVEIDICS